MKIRLMTIRVMKTPHLIGWLLACGINAAVLGATFPLPPPDTDVVGVVQMVPARRQDTLLDIARRFDLGYNEITEANPGVDPWLPGAGTRILLPTQFILPDAPRTGIVLDLSAMRLFYYPAPRPGERAVVITYPIGIGRMNWQTPTGVTRVVSRVVDPAWYVPPSIKRERAAEGETLPAFIPPGPDNPMGKYALVLGMPGYFIHGTNKPWGIGRRVSHGCVHLYPEDIAVLFKRVKPGTRVEFVDQPYLAGWAHGQLYLEAHQPLAETAIAFGGSLTPAIGTILKQMQRRAIAVDWDKALTVARLPRSVPYPVSVSAGATSTR